MRRKLCAATKPDVEAHTGGSAQGRAYRAWARRARERKEDKSGWVGLVRAGLRREWMMACCLGVGVPR